MLTGTIDEIAEQAGQILRTIASATYCVPQEWDNRIDCLIKLPGGGTAGEMVLLTEATEKRIREAGERLKRKAQGEDVVLVDELWSPIRIASSEKD